MTRAIAPLKQAEDAVYLDTSHMNIDEVVDAIKKLGTERGRKHESDLGEEPPQAFALA